MSHVVFQHYQFPIRDPYKAGQEIGEIEAGILNWYRAGLIQKTTSRWVMEVIEDSPNDILTMEELDEIESRLEEYDAGYELAARRPPKKSTLEYNLELVAMGILLQQGEFEPSEEDMERVKRTPEVQARARDLIRSSTFSVEELMS